MRVVALLAVVLTLAIVANAADLIGADSKTAVKDQYLVVFHRNSTVAIRDLHVAELIAKRFAETDKLINVFNIGTLIGYSAVLSEETLISELKHPNVRYIEADQIMSINEGFTTQVSPPSWGLDRTDQRALPLNQQYNYFTSAGTAVTAYVIDTGILLTHTQFGTRAAFGFSAITGETNTDLNGHGTHVAGTIGGTAYGIAKNVQLVAVKVLAGNGSGTTTGVISGVQWTTDNHNSRGRDARSVANMSLGGGASATLDDAVTQSIAAGISYAIAAGNNNGASACNYSPARVPTAVTVGATANTDARASFSNVGTCVTVFAPGQNIVSSYIGSNTATSTLSGTSMAAPHVAGVIAVRLGNLLADGNPVPPDPATIKAWISSTATQGVVTSPGTGSPNLLLYSPYQ
jgi:subtilisin family serine protease